MSSKDDIRGGARGPAAWCKWEDDCLFLTASCHRRNGWYLWVMKLCRGREPEAAHYMGMNKKIVMTCAVAVTDGLFPGDFD